MLPTKLITDDNFERMREEAKNKCNVLGENKVYSLVHLPSKLASWAYGLIDFNLIKKHAAVEDIVLLRQGELVASYNGDCNFFKKVSDVKDTEFVSSCVSAMVNLWIKRAYFLDDFINCLMASFDKDYFSQSVWERLISHAAKKRRAGLELKKHITSELITEEMADRLSSHNLDTLPPSDKITPERVNIFTRNRPEYIQFVRELGLLDMLDDDTLIKVSAWRNGKGYQLVPRERINRELLNRMIDARPNVILYLDEEHITDDLVDRATMNKPSTLLHLPRKFRNETRIMRTLSVYKDLYTHLKSEEKTKEINDYVLKTSPKSFIHVDMALTYEQVKNGVKDLPSALSRVPLIYRTVEVCQEALKSDPRAHYPMSLLGCSIC